MLNLYNHSVYSYKETISKVENIGQLSLDRGLKSFAIGDLNNMTKG